VEFTIEIHHHRPSPMKDAMLVHTSVLSPQELLRSHSSRQFHGLYKRDAASMRFSIHEIHEITALPNASTT
jgi:hypothetical protein